MPGSEMSAPIQECVTLVSSLILPDLHRSENHARGHGDGIDETRDVRDVHGKSAWISYPPNEQTDPARPVLDSVKERTIDLHFDRRWRWFFNCGHFPQLDRS